MITSNRNNNLSEILYYVMLSVVCLIAFIVIVSVFSGCREPKVITRIVTEIEYRDRVIHDTATFTIEREIVNNVTTDTTSNIETSYARSTASVENGFLTHTIENKPQTIKKPVTVIVHDTLYKESTQEQLPPVKEYIEKELTWWQRVRLDTYYILFGIIALYILIHYRKGIYNIIRMFLK